MNRYMIKHKTQETIPNKTYLMISDSPMFIYWKNGQLREKGKNQEKDQSDHKRST